MYTSISNFVSHSDYLHHDVHKWDEPDHWAPTIELGAGQLGWRWRRRWSRWGWKPPQLLGSLTVRNPISACLLRWLYTGRALSCSGFRCRSYLRLFLLHYSLQDRIPQYFHRTGCGLPDLNHRLGYLCRCRILRCLGPCKIPHSHYLTNMGRNLTRSCRHMC